MIYYDNITLIICVGVNKVSVIINYVSLYTVIYICDILCIAAMLNPIKDCVNLNPILTKYRRVMNFNLTIKETYNTNSNIVTILT